MGVGIPSPMLHAHARNHDAVKTSWKVKSPGIDAYVDQVRRERREARKMRPDLEQALRAAHEVAVAQRARLEALRVALRAGHIGEIVRCARAVVGMEDEEAPVLAAAPADLIDVDEAAAMLKLPKVSVYELARTGKIPHVRIGRRVRFDRLKLAGYLATRG